MSPGTDNSGEAVAFFWEQNLDGPLAIALSALAFALPHLGDSLTGRQAIAYRITGCAFGTAAGTSGDRTT